VVLPFPGPLPPVGASEVVTNTVTAHFTSKFHQVMLEVLRVLHVKDVAIMVAKFVMNRPSTHEDRTAYVSITIDETLVTGDHR
jgi:aspartate carbamoyltransferase regulatory subunit